MPTAETAVAAGVVVVADEVGVRAMRAS